MALVRAIDIGISPGNRTERGLSSVQDILSYWGKPSRTPTAAANSAGSAEHAHRLHQALRLLLQAL